MQVTFTDLCRFCTDAAGGEPPPHTHFFPVERCLFSFEGPQSPKEARGGGGVVLLSIAAGVASESKRLDEIDSNDSMTQLLRTADLFRF